MTASVECLSESDYPDRPVALTHQGRRLEILVLLAQGRTPDEKWFRVRTSDGQSFRLSYRFASDEWQVQQI